MYGDSRWQTGGKYDDKGFEVAMENEPAKSREQQREKRRQEILECGLNMIITRGFEATKIRDIAKELGISVGLFFNYFESKENLYEELIKIGLSGPASVLKLNRGGIEPIVLFEKMTEVIFESLRMDSISAKMFLLMAQTIRSKTAPPNVKKMLTGFDTITPLLQTIQQGQRQGKIKAGDPVALAIAYWGAVQGVAESYAVWPSQPLPQSSWIVDILRA